MIHESLKKQLDQYPQVETLIFDLGGVILSIDYGKTILALSSLAGRDISQEYSQGRQITLIDLYEKGQIDRSDFLNQFNDKIGTKISLKDFSSAWNLMLGTVAPQNLTALKELKKKYQLILLSNTNECHYDAFQLIMKSQGINFDDFTSLFSKTYYSHLINLRKPNKDIFQFVLKSHKLSPYQCLFIDDTVENIQGAKELKIPTLLWEQNSLLLSK